MSRPLNPSYVPTADPFMNPFYQAHHPSASSRVLPTNYPNRDNYVQHNQMSGCRAPKADPNSNPFYPVYTNQPVRLFNDKQVLIPNTVPSSFGVHDFSQNHKGSHVNSKVRTNNTQSFSETIPKLTRNNQSHPIAPEVSHTNPVSTPLMFQRSNTSHVSSAETEVPEFHCLSRFSSESTQTSKNFSKKPVKVASSSANTSCGSQKSNNWSQTSSQSESFIFSHRDSFDAGVFGKPEQEKTNPKVEGFMETIDKYELNPISLLNEVSGKLKKKVEYKVSESSGGRTKIFECVCVLEGQTIGAKKGTSKQNAKEEAAKHGIRTLLVEAEKYVTESAAIILSIQKSSEKALKQEKSDQISQTSFESKTTIDSDSNSPTIKDNHKIIISEDEISVCTKSAEKQEKPNTKSPLQELNNLARKFGLEPVWSFSPDTKEEGEYEIKLQFGDLVVQEKGKKKQEAKKEAAAKMLELIKEAQQENRPIVSEKKTVQPQAFEEVNGKKGDRARRLFEGSLKPNLLSKLQACNEPAPVQEKENFETYASSLVNKYQVDLVSNENLHVFFKKIMDYTSMITSNPKQIMLDAENHLADHIKECYLIPVGSFALGCMRNDRLTIDAMLTFHKVDDISDDELLRLYQYSLETCYCLDQQSGTNTIHMDFQFNIKSNDQGKYIEVVEVAKTEGRFKINIHLSHQADDSNSMSVELQNLPIAHIHRVYNSFDQSVEELNLFRNLLSIVKLWRRNSGLEMINPEILEVVLLHGFMTRKSSKIQENIMNFFTTLTSEKLTETILNKFDQSYQYIFNALSSDIKNKLTKMCRESLTCICQSECLEARLF